MILLRNLRHQLKSEQDLMAAEEGEPVTWPPLSLQFRVALDQQERIKMEAQDPAADDEDAHEIQVVCVGDPLRWTVPAAQIKQEPKEMTWEVQEKQLFLKGIAQEDQPLSGATPWDDTKVFPSSFEEVASACKWLTEEWGIRPTSILRGEGQQASGGIQGARGRRDFRNRPDALLLRETEGAEAQRRQFRGFSCPEAGGLHEVYGQLRDLCHRWLKPERRSKEQILELVILEQFLTLLPQEVQSWVRDQDPETCSHVIALAEDFLRRQRESKQREQENEEPFVEVMVDSPEGEDVPLDVWQRPLPDEIPQERVRKTRLFGECRTLEKEDGDGQRGNSEAEELRRMSPGEPYKRLVQRYGSFGEGGASKKHVEQPTVMIWGGPTVCVEVDSSVPKGTPAGRPIKYLCPECGRNFQHKSTLIRHQKMHTGERPHVCLECGKAFRRRDKLIRHQRIHTGQKPHGCPECGKSFRERGKLVSHQRIHTGEKPYPCPMCEKTYRWKEEFVKHLRIHTGERPYACLQCGKAFISKAHLVSHHRIHTGEKPYECPECWRRFCSKQSLTKHRRVHTGEKSFKCQDCGRVFHYISNFTKHQRIHANDGIV
ncbi:uncharacterized protein LOC110070724 [Pogona vitticeps]